MYNAAVAVSRIFRYKYKYKSSLQIDGCIDEGDEFKKQIDGRIRVFRNTKFAGSSGPFIPGDPERKAEMIRGKDGIPLIKPVVDDLLDIGRQTGIPFELK
jgi:LDH2 family malate/lactate/ureidoglycolate dehydrogenase